MDNHVILFFDDDLIGVQTHDDVVVMSMTITNYDIKWVLVNNKSFTYILFYDSFSQMQLPTNQLKRVVILLVKFTNDSVKVEWEILPITTGKQIDKV